MQFTFLRSTRRRYQLSTIATGHCKLLWCHSRTRMSRSDVWGRLNTVHRTEELYLLHRLQSKFTKLCKNDDEQWDHFLLFTRMIRTSIGTIVTTSGYVIEEHTYWMAPIHCRCRGLSCVPLPLDLEELLINWRVQYFVSVSALWWHCGASTLWCISNNTFPIEGFMWIFTN